MDKYTYYDDWTSDSLFSFGQSLIKAVPNIIYLVTQGFFLWLDMSGEDESFTNLLSPIL